MRPIIATAATLLVISSSVAVATLRANGASHTEFTSIVGLQNPCNGEIVFGTGPTKIVYLEGDDHFVVHWTFKMPSAVGDQGNTYLINFVANGQFAEPSGSVGNVTFFDVPVHSVVVTKGDAPNFDFDLGIRVYVVNGQATGSLFIGPASTTCH